MSADDPKSPEMQPDLERPAPARESNPTPVGPGTSPTGKAGSTAAAGAKFAAASAAQSPANRGNFYSAPPSATPPAVQTGNSWGKTGLIAVVVAAVALGGWFGVSHFGGSGTPTPPAVTQKHVKTFTVSKADLDAKATDQLKAFLAAGNSSQNGSAATDLSTLKAVNAQALAQLGKTSPQTVDELKTGKQNLYRIYLLDFLEEDGDHVDMTVNGVDYGDLYLRNAGTSFLIPLAPGQPADVKLLATQDGGGGGVTVGFISSLGESRTDILQVGQSEQWQVQVQ